jgi:DNA-directed RNA polymerase specialized sigma24 family protein
MTGPGAHPPDPRGPRAADDRGGDGRSAFAALAGLRHADRELLVDVSYHGMSVAQAAAARGITVAAVKEQLHDAMGALRGLSAG